MDIFEKIKFIRESAKLNQKEFAEKLNITQSTISKYEKKERTPDFYVLKGLFEIFNVNSNWIFFDNGPIFLDIDDNNITAQNQLLIQDINLILTPEEFNIKLNEILFEDTIKKMTSDNKEKSPIKKFLEAIKLEGQIPFRPILFLYYIFKYIRDNKEELNYLQLDQEEQPYQSYLLDLVKRYNVLSFKNNPMFTSQIKKQFEASIKINLSEIDCKRLLINYEQVLKNIESKMTPMIVLAHRKIDTKTLFPK
jgi:transcriptional regulator with XRE-family HTH domain